MKILLAQVNIHVGNFESNVRKIKSIIEEAELKALDLVVFPELAICGYPPRDFLDYHHFVAECNHWIAEIAKSCKTLTCVIGGPSVNAEIKGKDLYNSAFVLTNGKIQNIIHKTLLPTYDIFDEYRYFQPNTIFECIEVKGKKIALTICEDLWNIEENPLYVISPMDELIKQKPDLMLNIAASPFDYLHEEKRKNMLRANCIKYNLPLVYVNHIAAQTELIFDGGSLAMNNSGEIIYESKYFEEDSLEIDYNQLIQGQSIKAHSASPIAKIESALILGIRDYFQKSGFSKALLGLSGGIDSAVVCALATKALGKENVLAVLMPSQYSSDHSIADAMELVNNLGIAHELIPIEPLFKSFENATANAFANYQEDLTEENIQARIRGVLLMALSNKFGNILLNTSNKSEAAVGYGTLYGDMCGGISVIGDVYKTQVFELAKYMNTEKVIIPINTIVKPPSAELRPNQKDSDSLPDYDLLDQVLFQYIENRKGKDELIELGFDQKLIDRITGLVNRNEYKRYQTPPILRVSPKAFGMGRRMPIVAKY